MKNSNAGEKQKSESNSDGKSKKSIFKRLFAKRAQVRAQ